MDKRPLPLDSIPKSLCQGVALFFTDIDDTITHKGLLTDDAYQALWDLSRAGIEVVPVTGRPAGWCDHIARMWPVAAVIGENGVFYFSYDRGRKKMSRTYLISEEQRLAGREKLGRVRRRVLDEVPGCDISADQPFRLFDLAIDYCEDVEPLSKVEIAAICRIIEEEGASYKVSSIHINCWYGPHDKVFGVREYLHHKGLDLADNQESMVFIGDSPNDAPLFQALRHSIAVANIRPFLGELEALPAYITPLASAAGFCQAVETILTGRGRVTVTAPNHLDQE